MNQITNISRTKNFSFEPEYSLFLDKLEKQICSVNISNYVNISDYKKIIEEFLPKLGAAKRVRVDIESQMYVTAVYQKFGICIQFGNVSRFYADLIKLQHLKSIGAIKEGLIITLCKDQHKHFKLSNCTSFERASKEIKIFKTFINSPIMIFGINKL